MKRKASNASPHNLPIVSEQEFTEMVKKKNAPTEVAVLKGCVSVVKALSDDAGFRFTISTESVDRDRDVISVSGWRLQQYRQNPVVLWAHDYKSLPIGTTQALSAGSPGLQADMKFVPKDVYPFAWTVQEMVKLGVLRAASVGFKPLKYAYNEERRGVDVEESELLEWSIVPVPANAECLVQLGVLPKGVLEQFSEECERLLSSIKGDGQWVVGDLPGRLEEISVKLDKLSALPMLKVGEPSVGESHVGYPGCTRVGGCPTNAEGSPDNCQMADCPMKAHNVLPPNGQASAELGDGEHAIKVDDEEEQLIGISLQDIDRVLREETQAFVKGMVLEQMTAQFNYMLGRVD